jgi:hypothetical protein
MFSTISQIIIFHCPLSQPCSFFILPSFNKISFSFSPLSNIFFFILPYLKLLLPSLNNFSFSFSLFTKKFLYFFFLKLFHFFAFFQQFLFPNSFFFNLFFLILHSFNNLLLCILLTLNFLVFSLCLQFTLQTLYCFLLLDGCHDLHLHIYFSHHVFVLGCNHIRH